MEFKKDFKIKPKEVNVDGIVIFTDGTNDVLPNQLSCEAYGYKYDTETGTCYSFVRSRKLDEDFSNLTNKMQGENNKIQSGTHNTSIIGRNNIAYGLNENCLISGQGNTINNGVRNSTIIAGKGTTSRSLGETVLTGHQPHKTNVGQCSIVMLNCNTTDNTTTSMVSQINPSDATGVPLDYIPLPKNSIVGIEMYITRLEIGGSSGTAGNYSYRRQQSCIQIDNAASGTLVNFNTKNIAKIGVNGTFAITGATIADQLCLSVNVSDRNNVNNSWSAVLYLHITSTDVTF